jgi:hypothetical protein
VPGTAERFPVKRARFQTGWRVPPGSGRDACAYAELTILHPGGDPHRFPAENTYSFYLLNHACLISII